MRKSNQCPKCANRRIIHIDTVPDMGQYPSQIREAHVAAVCPERPGAYEVAGKLTATVCRECGYTEFYAENPKLIHIDGMWVRDVDKN
jgi:predicted nucleic-acid-binding Zn-ribbon protein